MNLYPDKMAFQRHMLSLPVKPDTLLQAWGLDTTKPTKASDDGHVRVWREGDNFSTTCYWNSSEQAIRLLAAYSKTNRLEVWLYHKTVRIRLVVHDCLYGRIALYSAEEVRNLREQVHALQTTGKAKKKALQLCDALLEHLPKT